MSKKIKINKAHISAKNHIGSFSCLNHVFAIISSKITYRVPLILHKGSNWKIKQKGNSFSLI